MPGTCGVAGDGRRTFSADPDPGGSYQDLLDLLDLLDVLNRGLSVPPGDPRG